MSTESMDSLDDAPSPQLSLPPQQQAEPQEQQEPKLEVKPEPESSDAALQKAEEAPSADTSQPTRRRSVKNKDRFSPEPVTKKPLPKQPKPPRPKSMSGAREWAPVSTCAASYPAQLVGRKDAMTRSEIFMYSARIVPRDFEVPRRLLFPQPPHPPSTSGTAYGGTIKTKPAPPVPKQRSFSKDVPKNTHQQAAIPAGKMVKLNLTKLAQKKGTLPVSTIKPSSSSVSKPIVATGDMPGVKGLEIELKEEDESDGDYKDARTSLNTRPPIAVPSTSAAAAGPSRERTISLSDSADPHAPPGSSRGRRDRKQRKEYSPDMPTRVHVPTPQRPPKESAKPRESVALELEPKEECATSDEVGSYGESINLDVFLAGSAVNVSPQHVLKRTHVSNEAIGQVPATSTSTLDNPVNDEDKPDTKRIRLDAGECEDANAEASEPLTLNIPSTPSARARTISTASSNLESPRTPSDRPRRQIRPPPSKEFSPNWHGAAAAFSASRSPQTPSSRSGRPPIREPKSESAAGRPSGSTPIRPKPQPQLPSAAPKDEDAYVAPTEAVEAPDVASGALSHEGETKESPKPSAEATITPVAKPGPGRPPKLTLKISAGPRDPTYEGIGRKDSTTFSATTPMTSEITDANRNAARSALPQTPAEWLAQASSVGPIESEASPDTIATGRVPRNKSVPLWNLMKGQSTMIIEDADAEAKKKVRVRKQKPSVAKSLEESFETAISIADQSAGSDTIIVDVDQSVAAEDRPPTPASRLSYYEPEEESESPEEDEVEEEEEEPSDVDFEPEEPPVVVRKQYKKRGRPSAAMLAQRRATIGELDKPFRDFRTTSISLSIPGSGRASPADSATHTPTLYQPTRRYKAYDILDEPERTRFFEMIHRRRQLNPLAIGLDRSCEGRYPKDYFYREVLMSETKHENSAAQPTDSDEDIDVGGNDDDAAQPALRQEVIKTLPADQCANDIIDLRWRSAPKANDEESVDDEGDDSETIESIMKRAQFLPNLVRHNLKIALSRIAQQRLIDAATTSTDHVSVDGGCSIHYATSVQNASRLREALLLYGKDHKAAVCQAHIWLLEVLPQPLLAAYLNLLRFLKVIGSHLAGYVADPANGTGRNPHVDTVVRDFLAPKVVEPPQSIDDLLADIEKPKNVSLLLVYPTIKTNTYKPMYRAHESMFRNLLPRAISCVEKVDLELDVSEITVEHMVQRCVEKIRDSIRSFVKRHPNDYVFVAGWATSCLLNYRALIDVSGVAGLLNFGFPLLAPQRARGEVDDDICLTYCPSLYVVGEHASDVDFGAMQRLRKNMICETGLVIVGGADRNLYVSPLTLTTERVSQRCVERTILGHVIDFIHKVTQESGMSAAELRKLLRPVTMPNVYEVDPSMLKAKSGGSTGATGGQAPPKPKKIDVRPAPPMPMPVQQPSTSHMDAQQQARMRSGTFPSRPHPGPSSLLRTAQTVSTDSPGSLFSARTTLDASLRTTMQISDLRLPSPAVLNKHLPPPMASETIREEDAAAASLSMDTFNSGFGQSSQDDPFANDDYNLML
ncbi:Protein F54D11.2 [Aphelenchoides avenae]|nr:Protein F54D11.2 [Aphelenchus avenae]